MIFSIVIALIILLKAIKSRERMLYFAFCLMFFTFMVWYNHFIGYFYWIFTSELLPYELSIVMTEMFYPIGILCWLYIYVLGSSITKKNTVIGILVFYIIIYEIYMSYFLFLAPNAPVEAYIASIVELTITPHGFIMITAFIFIVSGCVSGIHFSIKAMNRENNIGVRWKGRFLLIAFVLFFVQLVIDIVSPLEFIALNVASKIMLLIVIFFFYLGFLLPTWIRKIIARNKNPNTA